MYSLPFALSLLDFAVGAIRFRFSHILILLPVIWVYPLYVYGLEAGLNIPVYNFKYDYFSDHEKLYYILGASGALIVIHGIMDRITFYREKSYFKINKKNGKDEIPWGGSESFLIKTETDTRA
jgi:hypothetical protein